MSDAISAYAQTVLSQDAGPDPLTWAVQQHGENQAITDETTSLSFNELDQKVTECLLKLQQKTSSIVGTLSAPLLFTASPSIEYIVHLLACFRQGYVFVPVSTRTTEAEKNKLLIDLKAQEFTICDSLGHYSHQDKGQITTQTNYKKPINIMLSSGSTGTPKKIVHNLRAHILSAAGAESGLSLSIHDRYLLSLPLNHVGGQAIVFRSLLSGATMVLPATTNASNLAKKIKENDITVMSLVPTQLIRLIEDKDTPLNTSNLRAVILGGAPITTDLITRVKKSCPQLKLFATYGMTETAAQVCTSQILSTTNEIRARPLPFHEIIIRNNEILLKGPTIACGTLLHGKLTPLTDDNGFLHTGDLGNISNEGLSIQGRVDNMFISGGENICPETIEKHILNLDGVISCVVVPVPDLIWGQASCAIIKGSASPSYIRETLKKDLNSIYIPKYYLPWPQIQETGLKIKRQEFISYARGMMEHLKD